MRKNKLYTVLSILTIIFIFSFAALCNWCGKQDEGEKIGVQDEDNGEKDDGKKEDGDGKEDNGEEDEGEGEKEAPTIKLEIYEGPIYKPDGDICYYRIEAIVTGNPDPEVEFSKDDSEHAWGPLRVQVNLHDPSETYTLTATATNSEDKDSDSIDLSWGCDGENNDPQITDILIPAEILISDQYDVFAVAEDPDGDSLSYEWSVSVDGGTFEDENANPAKWNTPGIEGMYTLTIKVTDGNGGEDTMNKNVEVKAVMGVPIAAGNMPIILDHTGWIREDGETLFSGFVFAGDSDPDNLSYKGFICFDIKKLTGNHVEYASLKFNNPIDCCTELEDDPGEVCKGLRIEAMDWGNDAPNIGDFNDPGEHIQTFNNPDIFCEAESLKTELQKAVQAGRNFQLRIRFAGIPSADGEVDGWYYMQSDIVLFVECTPLP
ncbi:MAG: hypothetical protein H8E13_03295 [Actinobacteria bacterium]|nr:hypothetical protein [Actinomycetota bacterium]